MKRSAPDIHPAKQEVHIGRLSQPEVDALRGLLGKIGEEFGDGIPEKADVITMVNQELIGE